MMVFGELDGLGRGRKAVGAYFKVPSGSCLGAEGSLVTRQFPADNSNRSHE